MKPAARKGDHHACADNGPNMGAHLLVEEGSANITINGKPAARVGDTVSCRLTTDKDPVIAEGSASVFFNGKPAARMGDRVEKGGSVSSGSGNVFIGDRGTLITVGDNIDVTFGDGCGIYLNCGSPADASFKSALSNALSMVQMAKQTMPALSADASNTLSTTTDAASSETSSTTNATPQTASACASSNQTLWDMMECAAGETPATTNIASQAASECTSSNQTLWSMMQCSAETHIAPLSDKYEDKEEEYVYYIVTSGGFKQELTTWMWEDLSGIDITKYFEEERWVERPNEGGISETGRAKLARLSAAMLLLPTLYTAGIRHDLIHRLKLLYPQIKAKMQNKDGVLLQAIYDVQSADGEGTSINIYDNIEIIDSMSDSEYRPFIAKFITEPGLSERSSSDLFGYMMHLYIWVTKE